MVDRLVRQLAQANENVTANAVYNNVENKEGQRTNMKG